MLPNFAARGDAAVRDGLGCQPESGILCSPCAVPCNCGVRLSFLSAHGGDVPATGEVLAPRASMLERASFRQLLEMLDKQHEFELQTLQHENSMLRSTRCRDCRQRGRGQKSEHVSEVKANLPEQCTREEEICTMAVQCSVPEHITRAEEELSERRAIDEEEVASTQSVDVKLVPALAEEECAKETEQAMTPVDSENSCACTNQALLFDSEHSPAFSSTHFSMRAPWSALMRTTMDLTSGARSSSASRLTLVSQVRAAKKYPIPHEEEAGESDGYMDRFLDTLLSRCMIEPFHRFRICWSFLSILLLAFDMLVVPLDSFFQLSPTMYLQFLDWTSRLVWSLDVPFSFIRGTFVGGTLELRPSRVARSYLTVWFPLDLLLVVADWLSLLRLSGGAAGMIPLLRTFRLLRLLRLLRMGKLEPLFHEVMMLMPESVAACSGTVMLIIVIFLTMHIIACLWYGVGVGSTDGWAYELQASPTIYTYLLSMHWAVTQVHGTTPFHPQNAVEHGFAAAVILLGLVAAALFFGCVSHRIAQMTDSNHERVRQICRRYFRARKVSVPLHFLLNKHLASLKRQSFKEKAAYEQELIQALPSVILQELNEEVRRPLLVCNRFLCDVVGGMSPGGLLRKLCNESLQSLAFDAKEIVFLAGDEAPMLLLPESGSLFYFLALHGERDHLYAMAAASQAEQRRSFLSSNSRASVVSRRRGTISGISHISRGQSLCEAALWTDWVHMGDCMSETDSMLLGLEHTTLQKLVSSDVETLKRSVQYCRAFLAQLNELGRRGRLSDIVHFDVDISQLEDLLTSSDHFAFLCHYKEEAGTEAALMREDMEMHIRRDIAHKANAFVSPVFLDSEGLTDLSVIKSYVETSHNLVLLLTPNVLTRPWCAVEIVTAVKNGIPVVPIEIQRPGLSFSYPSEKFYQSLAEGEVFGDDGNRMLKEVGVEAHEVAECLRKVFHKVAVSYSPHKATKIRSAEVQEIIRRCVVRETSD